MPSNDNVSGKKFPEWALAAIAMYAAVAAMIGGVALVLGVLVRFTPQLFVTPPTSEGQQYAVFMIVLGGVMFLTAVLLSVVCDFVRDQERQIEQAKKKTG
jgi:hypothetical protein